MALVALGALLSPLLALAQPAPPDLSKLPPVSPEVAATVAAAASAPDGAASAPRRRCVAGCPGEASTRIVTTEDAHNRFEEHRNERGELVRLFVIPKNGAPRYEVLVGADRSKSPLSRRAIGQEPNAQQRDGQAVWKVLDF